MSRSLFVRAPPICLPHSQGGVAGGKPLSQSSGHDDASSSVVMADTIAQRDLCLII